jgi:O-antigen ligase
MRTDAMAGQTTNSFIIAVSFWVFLATVVLAPLPYGSVHLWSYSLLSILVGISLVLWAVAALLHEPLYAVHVRHYRIPATLFAIVLVWVFVQGSPAVPQSLHHPLWTDLRSALGNPEIPGAISLNPDGTSLLIARLGTYAAVFWLAMQYGRSAERAKAVFWAIAATGAIYALYGIWAHLSGSGKILFADKWAYHQSLTSTFVNRNHYAVFAGMGLITSVALAITYLKQDMSGALDSPSRFVNSLEHLSLRLVVLIAIAIVIASALLLTKSRGGSIGTALGLVVLIILLRTGGALGRRSSLGLLGVILASGLVVFAFSGGGLASRIADTLLSSDRELIHHVAKEAIAAAPFTGHGAGTFPALFHQYRDAAFPAISPAYASAHGVYLEFTAEVGLVAAGLYFGMLLLIATRCFIGARNRRRHQVYPAAGGAIAALIAFHSYFDFGPQIPGIAVTFAALLGVAYAQSWSTVDVGRGQ